MPISSLYRVTRLLGNRDNCIYSIDVAVDDYEIERMALPRGEISFNLPSALDAACNKLTIYIRQGAFTSGA